MRWDLWARGLAAAVIGGASNAVTAMIVDPKTFNLFDGGAKKLAAVCIVSALLSACLYLKEHPVPEEQ